MKSPRGMRVGESASPTVGRLDYGRDGGPPKKRPPTLCLSMVRQIKGAALR
jgi:hypothetical protein